jgi:arsenate reductase (thioredoxin)
LGIDISGQQSKPLQEFEGQAFDFVITVCDRAREECPAFSEASGTASLAIRGSCGFHGSRKERISSFRRLRDKIHARVMVFLGEGAYGSREAG